MRSGEIAELLGLKSKNTVINWTRDFPEFLSDDGAGRPKGATREYTEDDLFVFATIKEQRDLGLTTDQIRTVLSRNHRVTRLPEKPDPAVQAAKERVELVPTQDVTLWMDRYDALKAEMARIVSIHREEVARLVDERDTARIETKSENEKRIEAEKRASAMEGQIQRLGELEQTIARLQAEVQDKTILAMRLQPLIGQVEELRRQLEYTQWLLQEEKNRKRGLFGD